MAVFKCKMCGGDLEVTASIGTCQYCGTQQTLPKLDDDRKANLYGRANHFRRQNDFDKAAALFESILNEDRTDAEAYWSLVLCKYGVEYVEDPITHKRIPTCNRTQYTSVLTDEDYKQALACADTYQCGLYEEEAAIIEGIQKGILEVSAKEEPFDIFICYKEADNNGRRTPDSVLAQDMYHQLSNEGFKVFFSRITLEDKIGTAYEPYIFAALQSARVMVVLGTQAEHFNAVWVKNEWSRFLALIKKGSQKVLIPAFRDMDPYDLPEDFSHLQAQDMGKLGFMQDLIRGAKKILVSGYGVAQQQASAASASDAAGNNEAASVERLIKNGQTHLRLNNYEAAQKDFRRATEHYPEDHRGWWGLIVCATQGLKTVVDDQDSLSRWFDYVKQLADAKVFVPLEKEFVGYTRKVAEVDAEHEVRATHQMMGDIEAHMKTLVGRRGQVEQEKAQRRAGLDNQVGNYTGIFRKTQDDYLRRAKELRKTRISTIVAAVLYGLMLIAGIVGIVLFLRDKTGANAYLFLLLGAIFVVVAVMEIVKALRAFRRKRKNVNQAKDIVERAEGIRRKNSEAATTLFHKWEGELDEQIAGINSELNQAEARMAAGKRYLEHGSGKMSEMFFAQRCAKFGVEQHFDETTERLKQEMLERVS